MAKIVLPQEQTMPSELTVQAVHEGGMRFGVTAGEHALTFDYPLRPEDAGAGATPLQMLLASLAACSGSTLGLVLTRMKQPLEGLEVNARGLRRDEHPTVITEIALEFVVRGSGVDPEAVGRALTVAEDQLCPVWAMLKTGTPITASFRVVA
jgi:putative redox protein